jgi:hypothetical protein
MARGFVTELPAWRHFSARVATLDIALGYAVARGVAPAIRREVALVHIQARALRDALFDLAAGRPGAWRALRAALAAGDGLGAPLARDAFDVVEPARLERLLTVWADAVDEAVARLYPPGWPLPGAPDAPASDPPWGGDPDAPPPDPERYPNLHAAWAEARRQRRLGPSTRRALLLALVGAKTDLEVMRTQAPVCARARAQVRDVLGIYGLECVDYYDARAMLAVEGDARPAPSCAWWERWRCVDEAQALCLVLQWAQRVLELVGIRHPSVLWRK